MINFQDIVTSVSTGKLSPGRIGYYVKRLAAETATRRIASIFIIGLLIFQIFTFLAPPKPTYAASPGDLVSGAGSGFSKDSLINAVWGEDRDGISQVFGRLGITREKMEAAGTSPCASEGDHWISMGRDPFPGSGSVEWQTDIWVGDSVNRWGNQGVNDGNCWTALRGLNDYVHVTDGGPGIPAGDYEWAVLLDCGNILLKKVDVPNPKSFSCSSVGLSANTLIVGDRVRVTGTAHGENVSQGEFVDMVYGAYRGGTNDRIGDFESSAGVGPPDGNGNFVDDSNKGFTFNEPGTYDIALVVFYDVGGTKYFAAPNENCKKTITVNPRPQPRTLVCAQLDMVNSGGNFTYQAPHTPLIQGEASQAGDTGPEVYAKRFLYLLLKEVPSGGSVQHGGKQYIEIDANNRILHSYPTQNTRVDPLASAPNPAAFAATQFAQTSAGSFLILMRVSSENSGNNNYAPDTDSCAVPFVVTPQPKDIMCVDLTASPLTGDTVPVEVTFNARGGAQNTTIKEYQFDFGDGNKQTVTSGKFAETLKHTYQNGGKYTAKVTVVGTDPGVTSSKPSCTVQLKFEQHVFRKTVKNLTILTQDGKPTDANGATARPGDKLTYTIGIANIGSVPIKDYVFKDDISDIILYADLIDKGGAELKVEATQTFLIWPAVDIPVTTDPNNPTYVTKSFTVQVKDPVPTTAQKPTDSKNYDCQMEDQFEGNIVITPISVNPAKRLECVVAPLPQTGAATSLIVMGLLAALSVFLLLRNRLMKRELDLLETLNEGAKS